MQSLHELACRIVDVLDRRVWQAEPAPSFQDLSITDAYEVQDLVAHYRIERGETSAGYKVGCTSAAIREQFGLTEPIFGRLFGPHVHRNGETLDQTSFLGCAIEPELIFSIQQDLSGHNLSDDELRNAISSVGVGIEVHHYHFHQRPPTIQELICSGGLHPSLVVGDGAVPPADREFRTETFSVEIDGRCAATGRADAIMGGPLNSLRWLVGRLTEAGRRLKVGQLVIPGSPVELIRIEHDCRVRVSIGNIGDATCVFRGPGG